MKIIHWRWLLPTALLALALVGDVFSVHQRQLGLGAADVFRNWPPPLERISDCVSFPALVLAYPLHHAGTFYGHLVDWGFILVTAEDIGIFAGIVLFWYLAGAVIDRHFGRYSGVQLDRTARIAAFVGGMGFGVLTAAYGDYLLGDYFEGPRQIGVCGIVWGCVLIIWFVRQLLREACVDQYRHGVILVVAVTLSVTGALWIGGPFGSTQALGEYLRPSRARSVLFLEPTWGCSSNESAPTTAMQYIQSQMALHNLTLQKLTVCKAVPTVVAGFPGQIDCDEKFLSMKRRAWQKIGCGTSQFRRHFDVSIVVSDGQKALQIQAILIQSRWDYLKSNWNTMRTIWSWPYEGYTEPPREWTIIREWDRNGGM